MVTVNKEAHHFLRRHKEIMVTKADKGNITVAMLVTEYRLKMENMLSDITTYSIIDKDPTSQITNYLGDTLKKWKMKRLSHHHVITRFSKVMALFLELTGYQKFIRWGFP